MAKATSAPTISEHDRKIRRQLFRPCATQQALKNWLDFFLDLDLPDHVVDPDSTTSPFGLVWEVYRMALDGHSEDVTGVLGYAARASFKTLAAAVLEILMLYHADRDVVHLAAIEKQSLNAQKYVRGFLERPYLRDFILGDNKRQLEVVRYYKDDPLDCISNDEYTALPETEQVKYTKSSLSIEVAVCTPQGVQGLHCTFFVCDELDVIRDPQAYKDAKLIPSMRRRNGRRQIPITLMISTRKSGAGLVQAEIDDAQKLGVKVHHWNIVDVTESCPPERHLPDLPRIPTWVRDDELRLATPEEYEQLPLVKREGYTLRQAYAGCLSKCKMFASCRGLLATGQKSQALTLKSVGDTQRTIQSVGSADLVNAQCLSRKPSSEDLVYPRLDADVHFVDLEEFADQYDLKVQNIEQLVSQLRENFGARVSLGLDFGFTHNFAGVGALILPPFCLIFDAFEVPQLEEPQQIALCKERFAGELAPERVWADPAYPGATKSFRRQGLPTQKWSKKPGSVAGGIQICRTKMRPLDRPPELLFLSGVPGVKALFDKLRKYSYKRDAQGNLTDVPNDADDDGCDAVRYLVMNEFPVIGGGVTVASGPSTAIVPGMDPATAERVSRYNDQILNSLGIALAPKVVSKGRLRFLS